MPRSSRTAPVLPRYHSANTFSPEEGVVLPVAKSQQPLLSSRLQKTYALFQKGGQRHEHTLVASFTIQLPHGDWFQNDLNSSDCLSRFLLVVKSRIKKDSQSRHSSSSSPVWHIALRDHQHPRHPTRLHIVLVIDGTLYPSRRAYEDHEKTLLIQIQESLASVLSIPLAEVSQHVLCHAHYSGIRLHRFASTEDDDFGQAFLHASQLCTQRRKMPGWTHQSFLMSRAS